MDQYFQINGMFWRDSPFQYMFYASIVLILILDRQWVRRIVFGIFPLLMVIGMFNPLTSRVIGLFFRNPSLYYVRLFTVIPVFYCMAHGITLLLSKIRGVSKPISALVTVALIVFCGHSIYAEPWMQRAENAQKTPNEVFSVLAAIPREKKDVKVALPNPLYLYARQVDANILMPYGRQNEFNGLLNELNKPVPDVTNAMRLAGNESVDYIVVNKSDETRAAFSDCGFVPCAETEGYSIYPVQGVARYNTILNDKRQVISTTACDSNGDPAYSDISVITTHEFEYDKWGNQTRETYYDKDGRRVTTIGGYSGIRRSYMLRGLSWAVESIVYLDAMDQPILCSGRYETRYRYIRRKEVYEERYYDREGRPMNREDTGYAIALKEYDKSGRIISERFFDAEGSAVNTQEGYAGYAREYDDNGRPTTQRYYDANGALGNNTSGFAVWNRYYDEAGNVIEERFLDRDGQLVDVAGQCRHNPTEDLLQRMPKNSIGDAVGICYQWKEDGSCEITGEAQGISWNSLFNGDRPFYLMNGETYRVEYSSENVYLTIAFYEDASWKNEVVRPIKVLSDTEFTVPRNCGAVGISLWIGAGTRVNETVHPRIFIMNDGQ